MPIDLRNVAMSLAGLSTAYSQNTLAEWIATYRILYEIHRVRHVINGREAMVVSFRGSYWGHGKDGEKTRQNCAPFMRWVVAQAVLWPPTPGEGIVVDLSELDYSSGDELLSWVSLLRWRLLRDTDYRIAVVWSQANKDAIASLLQDSDEDELLSRSFDHLEQALASVCE